MKARFLLLLVLVCPGLALGASDNTVVPQAGLSTPLVLPWESIPKPIEVSGCVGTIDWHAFSQSYCDSGGGGDCGNTCAEGQQSEFHGWNGQYCYCVCCAGDLELQ